MRETLGGVSEGSGASVLSGTKAGDGEFVDGSSEVRGVSSLVSRAGVEAWIGPGTTVGSGWRGR